MTRAQRRVHVVTFRALGALLALALVFALVRRATVSNVEDVSLGHATTARSP